MSNDTVAITLPILEYMAYGLTVFDAERKKLGVIDDYNRTTGYITVRPHKLSETLLYMPFHAINYIDSREVFVSVTQKDAERLYHDLPPRDIALVRKVDPRTGEDRSRAVTTQPNGYDGTPVIVCDLEVDELLPYISPGFEVYGAEMEYVGTIKDFDTSARRMLIEKGDLSTHDFSLSVAVVSSVDRDARNVYLAVASADLRRFLGTRPQILHEVE